MTIQMGKMFCCTVTFSNKKYIFVVCSHCRLRSLNSGEVWPKIFICPMES